MQECSRCVTWNPQGLLNSWYSGKRERRRNILNESQFGYDCNCAMHQLFFKSVSHTWENSN